jgi:hypothetical protein
MIESEVSPFFLYAQRELSMSETFTAAAQTEYKLLRRVQGLVDYLYQIEDQELITPRLARLAWDAWTTLSNSLGNALSVPDACPGSDGELLYTWDRDEHHFELEVFPDAPAEFFYRNRTSGELWGCEYTLGEPVPCEALDRLRLFV